MDEGPAVEARDAREALLKDLADVSAFWSDWLSRLGDNSGLSGTDVHPLAALDPDQQRALAALARQAVEGLVHSVLVVLDGRAHRCPQLDLRDPDGRSLGDALHEEWYDYAPSAQRE